MSHPRQQANQELLFEVDDHPPLPVTLGLGLLNAALTLATVVLVPTILITSAGENGAYLDWAVFMALIVSGVTTIIQSQRFGRLGAGYILVMGSTGAFLAVSVNAVEYGGPALLATLILVSSLAQFTLGFWLAAMRHVITPVVSGTVLILMPVSIAPLVFQQLNDVPLDASSSAGPVTALVTLLLTVFVSLRFTGHWRLWALAIGISGGTLTGLALGIYDIDYVAQAPWFGLPGFGAYPGLDLSFGVDFWALLPGFLIVTLVGAMETLGKAIAIQRVSWRVPRAIDFRSIQGAINADGLGNLLSGLSGTVPNSTYGDSVAVAEITGVAAKRIGVCAGIIFILVAFMPKFIAVIVAIPGPVAAVFLVIAVAMLFVFGMKILISAGLDFRKGLIVGVSFWVGLLFQFDLIYPVLMQGLWEEILGNGMTAGGIFVILLSGLLDLTRPRPRRLRTRLAISALPEIDAFLGKFGKNMKLGKQTTTELRAAGEETLHILLDASNGDSGRDLLLVARADGKAADLEFIAGGSDTNLEDQLAMLSEGVADIPNESEAPLRLLRHYATSVRHQQYHGADIATIRLEPRGAA